MRGTESIGDVDASGKDRIKHAGTEERFGPFIFPAICRRLRFTAKDLARIGGAHPRTAEFWLSGKVEAPPIVWAVMQTEAIKRDRELRAALRG